jgi:predicted alpha/beta-hydrolase family hydrolase
MLDSAWIAVLERLRSDVVGDMALVVGGRSSGARVACRTSEVTGPVGVLCLAFPLVPPRRTAGSSTTRLPELDAVRVPTLVVQGERDPFGMPPRSTLRQVVTVSGDHSLRSDLPAVAAAVRDWLLRLVG